MIGSVDLPAGVDVIKATAYLYDLDHDTGGDVSDVDMYLERELSPGFWWSQSLDTSEDNKLRVIRFEPGPGDRYRLRFHGTHISNSSGPCGANSQNVKWSYFYESSSRNVFVDGFRPEGWVE